MNTFQNKKNKFFVQKNDIIITQTNVCKILEKKTKTKQQSIIVSQIKSM